MAFRSNRTDAQGGEGGTRRPRGLAARWANRVADPGFAEQTRGEALGSVVGLVVTTSLDGALAHSVASGALGGKLASAIGGEHAAPVQPPHAEAGPQTPGVFPAILDVRRPQ